MLHSATVRSSRAVKSLGSWHRYLSDLFDNEPEQIDMLKATLRSERRLFNIYPPPAQTLRALRVLPIEDVRVVILGQDPYHTPGVANGLAFAVNSGIVEPPSLVNIHKEMVADVGSPRYEWGVNYAEQGVLLLNTSLTVREGQPGSHSKLWTFVTQELLRLLLTQSKPIVFALWGRHAQNFVSTVQERVTADSDVLPTSSSHLFLSAAHPSPFSCSKFFGCRHFSKINTFLANRGDDPIVW